MSASGTGAADSTSVLRDLPQFDLEFEFDDPVEPGEVTVFEVRPEENTTRWITADVEDAIDLAAVA